MRSKLCEAILMTRSRAQPPAGEECNECRRNGGTAPFPTCISGGWAISAITTSTTVVTAALLRSRMPRGSPACRPPRVVLVP